MRIQIIPFATAAALVLASAGLQAKPSWPKKAQELGFTDIKDCSACHTKAPALGDLGKWLMAEKAKRKASAVDLHWISDYKKP
jgi:hypothetical protein